MTFEAEMLESWSKVQKTRTRV